MIPRPKKEIQEKQGENEGLFTREPTPEIADNISEIRSEITESKKRGPTDELKNQPERKHADQRNYEPRNPGNDWRNNSRNDRRHESSRNYGQRNHRSLGYEHDTLKAATAIFVILLTIVDQLVQLQQEDGRDCKEVYR